MVSREIPDSKSNVNSYTVSYNLCTSLNDKLFKDLRLVDLQHVVDTCGNNYPTLRNLKVLFNQLYYYAIKNYICNKNYSEFVDIIRYNDRNPNKYDRKNFSKRFTSLFSKVNNNLYSINTSP